MVRRRQLLVVTLFAFGLLAVVTPETQTQARAGALPASSMLAGPLESTTSAASEALLVPQPLDVLRRAAPTSPSPRRANAAMSAACQPPWGAAEVHCYVAAEQIFTDKPKIHALAALVSAHTLTSVKAPTYSLGQLTLGVVGQLDLEYLWLVDPSDYGNSLPHLAVAMRTPGNLCVIAGSASTTGCAKWWRPVVGTSPQPGDVLCGRKGSPKCGTPVLYAMGYYRGAWWIQYGDHYIGRLPVPGYWQKSWTDGDGQSLQGEVVIPKQSTCAPPMGSGAKASDPAAAYFHNLTWVDPNGVSSPAELSPLKPSNSALWDMGRQQWNSSHVSVRGFSYGGPGTC